ncbi:aminotransferase class V-fold PLP-dependent enzyme [Leptobacterium flavescens]|uniref:Aminotransferase class V-fold PLP-dependent enzyme n=1 Tax=Leptobacterium flavescens TaxID=472055 RepID=A0A6P0US68_9FLAO|nr:aminotransferase class I/II-fold pyridoxal phosphate-dependent enzyme [Leptobacterium flavescens]NER15372.1 aminotransferase class V-fold PLP-dependent enzyme [Leptobacterium flavescens]
MKDLNIETLLTHDGKVAHSKGAVVPPIYQNSLFTMESWDAIDKTFDDRVNSYIYSRGNNPSARIVEEKLAEICGGESAKLFASGMGAISAAILSCIKKGSHIITVKNIYGPANNLLQNYFKPKFDIDITYISGTNITEFEDAIRADTSLIYLESPSSVVFSLQDIETVVKLAKPRGIKTIIDNTWASPVFQKPLSFGVDLEIHSCSKYIGGHSDVVAGVVIGSQAGIDSIFTKEFELLGAKIAPFEAWLLLRSLRTLKIRMDQHQKSALEVARFLEDHPKIEKVYYPGLESFPQYELGKKQMSGFSGLMSFQLKTSDLEKIKKFFNSLSLFQIGVSWGGHESLIYAPAISYLKELTEEQFAGMGIHLGDMRISVGLEAAEDLISDLDKCLKLT